MRQQLPWRSVARRPDSAAGREPKVSSVGMFLKPLRVKKRHHSREKKRKQTDSRQQTGKTRKGNAGGASARPGFPGAAGARSFCPSRRQDDRFKTATVRSQRFIPCIKLSPCGHAFQQFTKYVSLFHLCPLRLLSGISQQTSRPGFEIDLPAPACDQGSDCVHL